MMALNLTNLPFQILHYTVFAINTPNYIILTDMNLVLLIYSLGSSLRFDHAKLVKSMLGYGPTSGFAEVMLFH